MNRKNLITATLVASLLGGCQTLDPYTGEQKTSNTAKGAGIGAVAGGVAGALLNKKDRGKGAAIGALVGRWCGWWYWLLYGSAGGRASTYPGGIRG